MPEFKKDVPTFLGIGAPRAGTTWLYANLRWHRQIYMPSLKELHYFDLQRPGATDYYPVDRTDFPIMGRMFQLSARSFRRVFYARHILTLLRRGLELRSGRFGWCMKYIFGSRNDHWYTRLFRRGYPATGEITPAYMILPRHVVEDIHKINPQIKIILLLRNPVSRAWSQTRLLLGKRAMTATEETIRQVMDSPAVTMRSDYVTAIKNWRGVFGDSQVFVGFFDDLMANPRELLRSILQFLGVDADDSLIQPTVDKVVNRSRERELPESLVPHCYAGYIDQLRELEKMVGGPVSKWLKKAEEAVSREQVTV